MVWWVSVFTRGLRKKIVHAIWFVCLSSDMMPKSLSRVWDGEHEQLFQTGIANICTKLKLLTDWDELHGVEQNCCKWCRFKDHYYIFGVQNRHLANWQNHLKGKTSKYLFSLEKAQIFVLLKKKLKYLFSRCINSLENLLLLVIVTFSNVISNCNSHKSILLNVLAEQ